MGRFYRNRHFSRIRSADGWQKLKNDSGNYSVVTTIVTDENSLPIGTNVTFSSLPSLKDLVTDCIANTRTSDQIVLETLLVNNLITPSSVNFAQSLSNQNRLSTRQEFFVKKLIDEAMAIQVPSTEKIDLTNIFKLFEGAKNSGLKYPKVHVQTKQGSPITLAPAGSKGNFAGCIYLAQGKFGSEWYGTIKPDNSVMWRNGVKNDNIRLTEFNEFLTEFNKDPVAYIVSYGKFTSNCSFCHKTLSTPESLAVGYGPNCAKAYNLPWGKV